MYVILKLLYVFSIWLYFIAEGFTEGIGTNNNPHLKTKKQQNKYHLFRVLENLGILIAVHIIISFTGIYKLYTLLYLSIISGLGLYEMSFSYIKYGNPIYNKTSKWFFLPHSPGWVSLIVFIVWGLMSLINAIS